MPFSSVLHYLLGGEAPVYQLKGAFFMYIKLVNEECDGKTYPKTSDLANLLAYVFRVGKTLEDTVRNNPGFLGCYTGCEPSYYLGEAEHNCASVFGLMTAVNEMFPKKRTCLAKHRLISFQSSELVLPQDLDSLGRQITLFYSEKGYIAAYGVHADHVNAHIHIIVSTTNYVNGNNFSVSFEKNHLYRIAGNWLSKHNSMLEKSESFQYDRENILYGTPEYGQIAAFPNDQIRLNKKKANRKSHHHH